nr:MAG TPA: Glutathione peroxidase [Caudoviricetes sp.]
MLFFYYIKCPICICISCVQIIEILKINCTGMSINNDIFNLTLITYRKSFSKRKTNRVCPKKQSCEGNSESRTKKGMDRSQREKPN